MCCARAYNFRKSRAIASDPLVLGLVLALVCTSRQRQKQERAAAAAAAAAAMVRTLCVLALHSRTISNERKSTQTRACRTGSGERQISVACKFWSRCASDDDDDHGL